MSVTVVYKGDTLTTVTNETKTLSTKATWMEDDLTLTDSTTRVVTTTVSVTSSITNISFPVEGDPTKILFSLTTGRNDSFTTAIRPIVSGVYDGQTCYLKYIEPAGTNMVRVISIEGICNYENGVVTISTPNTGSYQLPRGTYDILYSFEP